MTKGGWDDTGTQAVKNYMEEVDAITDIDPRIGDDYTEQEPQEPLNAEKYTVPADWNWLTSDKWQVIFGIAGEMEQNKSPVKLSVSLLIAVLWEIDLVEWCNA